ncbi:NADP-dependent oxidoreductase [Luteolibacter algae]|uniref:NADP-dependent oxidoreductase n=1 Tax=Luteolibacter algae TaxID=454151 RepID=A0ABW5DBS9_9BACT
MSHRISRQIQLKSRPAGMPEPDNFQFVEVPLPEPAEGEFIVENKWISVDPYMRGRMKEGASYVEPFGIGEAMEGGCVGVVLESRNEKFPVGCHVLGNSGWRDTWISDGERIVQVDASSTPLSCFLSILGMTGMTAYAGLLEIGELKDGDNVFVSAASGAVGSIVCQIAKLKGCRVVGSAGSREKIEWLKEYAGVDEAFNYHDTSDVSSTLKDHFPDGIDVYFDNVGGDHLAGAIDNMRDFGRIVCCGMISGYNDEKPKPGPANLFKIIGKRVKMQGFIVRDHESLREKFLTDMNHWIDEGMITWEESVTEGLENAPEAFMALFNGDKKMGKALVKL